MAIGFTLFLSAVFGIAFVVLALSEKRTYVLQVIYALVAAILTFVLGVTFGSLGFDHGLSTRVNIDKGFLNGVEVEVATRWATRGFGGWLVVLAAGELLRLMFKPSETTHLLAPAVLFLAGALLIEPHWGLGVALAVALICATGLAICGRRVMPETAKPVVNAPELADGSSVP
ncbi:MAG TPA: hypothetical protein VHR66_12720 [Gemmataceae bacterium]|jgi:hypothetical protein|nr:hypothetical protein [Gemmataceae bacterium]